MDEEAALRETHELEEAAQKLSIEVLQKSLEANEAEFSSNESKTSLTEKIGQRAVRIGIEGFVKIIDPKQLTDACKAAGVNVTGNKRATATNKEKLLQGIIDKGVEEFLINCHRTLLTHFCIVLLLEQSSKEKMLSQIADEIMLTGTKKFLQNLPIDLLRKWCEGLQLSNEGSKKVLVERLMVHMFELEPLGEDEGFEEEAEPKEKKPRGRPKKSDTDKKKDEDEKKKKKKTAAPSSPSPAAKKGKKREAPAKNDAEKESEQQADAPAAGGDEKEDGEGEATSSSSAASGAEPPTKKTKREKYVPPPISTITKGMTKQDLHNLFNLTDLKEYCKQNDLSTAGTKPALMKRIVKFLETGEKEVAKPKGKRGRKPGGGKKKGENGDAAAETKAEEAETADPANAAASEESASSQNGTQSSQEESASADADAGKAAEETVPTQTQPQEAQS